MEIEDRLITSTPEGVSLSVVLAGAGSRAAAYLIDFAVQVAVLILTFIVLALTTSGGTTGLVALGVFSFVSFVDLLGYFILFEMLDAGRSLGKRALGLRVTLVDGSGITFRASLVRNLMRVLYFTTIFYLVDGLLILTTKRNQRLGDLLGGTIVIRERIGNIQSMAGVPWADPRVWSGGAPGANAPGMNWSGALPATWPGTSPAPGWPQGQPYAGWLPPELASLDVTAITQADLAVVHTYLSRRLQYDPVARRGLAEDLARRLWPKVAGLTIPMDPERFLEAISIVKTARG